MASAPTVELFRFTDARGGVPTYSLSVPRSVIETAIKDVDPAFTVAWTFDGETGSATTTAPMFLQMIQVHRGTAFVEIDSLRVIHTDAKDADRIMTVPDTHIEEAVSSGSSLPYDWWCAYFRSGADFKWDPNTLVPKIHVDHDTMLASSQHYTQFLGGGRRWSQTPLVDTARTQHPRLLKRRSPRPSNQILYKVAMEGLGASVAAGVSVLWPIHVRENAKYRHRTHLLATLLNVSRSAGHRIDHLAHRLCVFLGGYMLSKALMKEESRQLSYEARRAEAIRSGEEFTEAQPRAPFGDHPVINRLVSVFPETGNCLYVLPPSRMQWMMDLDHAHASTFGVRLNAVALVQGHLVVTARMVLSVAASISASLAIPDVESDPVPPVRSKHHALFNKIAMDMQRSIQSWSGIPAARNVNVRKLGIDVAIGGDGTSPALPPCIRRLYRRCTNLIKAVNEGKTVTEEAKRAIRPKNNHRWIIQTICQELGLPTRFWKDFVRAAYSTDAERKSTLHEYTGKRKTRYYIPSCKKLKVQHGFCPIKCEGSLDEACLAAHEKYNPGVTAAAKDVPESVYRGTVLFHTAAGLRARRAHVKLSMESL